MIRQLLALALLFATACASPIVPEIPEQQGRYDTLDEAGLASLRSARAALDASRAGEARVELEALRGTHPDCVYVALWLQEAEIAEQGLDAVWLVPEAAAGLGEEQKQRLEALRQRWRAPAAGAAPGLIDLLLAARLELDPVAARKLLERAAALDPHCAWVPYARAFVAARQREWPEAAAELARAQALDPAHLPTRWLSGWMLARGGDPEKARATLELWLEHARGDARIDLRLVNEAELDLAVLSVLEGEPKVARNWIDKLEGELPDTSRVLCARACVEEARGHPERALELAQQAADQAPAALLPLVQIALLQEYWLHDAVKAEAAWAKVRALARNSPEFGALFERLRSGVELERGKLRTKETP